MLERAQEILNTILKVPYDRQAVNACIAEDATLICVLNRAHRQSIIKIMNKEENDAFVTTNRKKCINRNAESQSITVVGDNLYSYKICHCQTLENHGVLKDGVYSSQSSGYIKLNNAGLLVHFLYEKAIPKIKKNSQ